MDIMIKESVMVRPTKDTPKHTIWNSNLNLLAPRAHTPTVYFYRPNGSPNFFNTNALKQALSDVLVPFYPAAGRLNIDADGRLEINCNREGVLFIEAESDAAIDSFENFHSYLTTL